VLLYKENWIYEARLEEYANTRALHRILKRVRYSGENSCICRANIKIMTLALTMLIRKSNGKLLVGTGNEYK